MNTFDFNEEINRKDTNCLKYDFAKEYGVPEGLLSLWVADMDFRTAPAITKRLEEAVRYGIFGYSDVKDDYFGAVASWYETHFGWKVEREWLIKTPGVVFALAMAVKAYTEPGDAVLIQQPVYYPFSMVIKDNGRRVVNSPLVLQDGHYEIDFADVEQKIEEENVKLFLLCSPHNPVGRVWKKEELIRLEEICLKHDVIVVSDEIHSDFVWDDNRHYPLCSLNEAYQKNTIICTAPSKSFNLAGLQVSNIFIPNPELRRKLRREIDAAGYSQLNQMGLIACQAAYEEGEAWLTEVKQYIRANIAFAEEYVAANIPGVTMIHPEGTYLIWLDFRALGLSKQELEDLIVKKAKLWLDSGSIFGEDGTGFQRINTACTRKTLTQALERIERAVKEH